MPYLEIDSDGHKVVSRVENYANYHAGFGALLRGETIGGILSQLQGEEVCLFKVSLGSFGRGGEGRPVAVLTV